MHARTQCTHAPLPTHPGEHNPPCPTHTNPHTHLHDVVDAQPGVAGPRDHLPRVPAPLDRPDPQPVLLLLVAWGEGGQGPIWGGREGAPPPLAGSELGVS